MTQPFTTPDLWGHDLNGTTAHRPTNVEIGFPYWDTNLGRLVYWSGSEWLVQKIISTTTTTTTTTTSTSTTSTSTTTT